MCDEYDDEWMILIFCLAGAATASQIGQVSPVHGRSAFCKAMSLSTVGSIASPHSKLAFSVEEDVSPTNNELRDVHVRFCDIESRSLKESSR